MAQSKAHIKATNKYISNNYDRFNLLLPRGQKDIIKAHAETLGLRLNAYINKLISEDMNRAGSGTEQADD